MIVPQYWAEASRQNRAKRRSVTIRRFGWSDASMEEAQANADKRADEALARALAGEKIIRLEPKKAYNGADGVPIREEIVSRHEDTIITRNSYGAQCLNTPDVLFVDIDLEGEPSGSTILFQFLILFVVMSVAWAKHSFGSFLAIALIAGLAGMILLRLVKKVRLLVSGGPEKIAHLRIARFAKEHPDWHLRLYRTPAGFRILVMQRLFDPKEEAVANCFRELGTDPVYARMCVNQHCFRARVSPKPWRIGIKSHLRKSSAWPVKPEHLAVRTQWINDYEQAAGRFASCRFVESLGVRKADPKAELVQKLHDELCRSGSQLAIA